MSLEKQFNGLQERHSHGCLSKRLLLTYLSAKFLKAKLPGCEIRCLLLYLNFACIGEIQSCKYNKLWPNRFSFGDQVCIKTTLQSKRTVRPNCILYILLLLQ